MEGRLDQMRRHRFVTSWVLDIPDLGTDNTVVRAVLNGWQLTGIVQYQSGSPYTITSGADISRDGIDGDRAKTTGVSLDRPAGSDQTVWFNPAALRRAMSAHSAPSVKASTPDPARIAGTWGYSR